MSNNKAFQLPIAVRVYPHTESRPAKFGNRNQGCRRPDRLFVFDTETRIDTTQRLLFGSYRYLQNGECLEEGLFCADDLSTSEREVLEKYVSEHKADAVSSTLRLLTRADFLKRMHLAAYKERCLLVGFNLSFDLSRVAFDIADARGRFNGGFSLGLWSYTDQRGSEQRNQFRPRIGIKQIDSKRALRGFLSPNRPDEVDMIPEDGKPFQGHFLDLRTLAFALTDRGYSLEAACEAFGVKNGKTKSNVHGILIDEYIDYNRRDVQATAELAYKLFEEYDKHPISLEITKAYSPASIGKAYLREMGISPVLQRQPDFPKHLLGYAQSAFFGGRTSAHIRKYAVPVIYTDFLSMYPTVNSLMNLWRFVVAKEIRCVEDCKVDILNFLQQIKAGDLFNPSTWKNLTAFVKVIPNGDIFPHRAKCSIESNDWQVGLNHLYQNNSADCGLWFSLPDIVASVILTGRIPEVIDAFRIEPVGVMKGLKAIKLRGQIEVDPAKEDFFKVVIEQRKGLSKRRDLSEQERDWLDKALKVLANATSYGIYAEMNARESDKKVKVICHGIDREPFSRSVAHPDDPGRYCFPPLASLITGGARLMLALLEHSVTELGGTYAMEDTDSMAIVATKNGGHIRCSGGTLQTDDGHPAILALSWKQVASIVKLFESLNPYNRELIPGSVLKIEDANFDLKTKKQRQIYCFAISAKRYALFLSDEHGRPQLLQQGINSKSNGWKEHGLGHLLNPTDPESDDREWTAEIWRNIINRSLKLQAAPLTFANLPAVGRVTVSSPAIMKALKDFNAGKVYRDQIKPFNFLLTAHVIPLGHPTGTNPNRFHLIAPFELDSRKWLATKWIDQYSSRTQRICGWRKWRELSNHH